VLIPAEVQRHVRERDVAALRAAVGRIGRRAVLAEDEPMEIATIHLAASAGAAEVVELLLGLGADPRAARNNRFTPLHAAAMHGHAEVCAVLLASGAAVDVQTAPQGYAPLHSAAWAGHLGAIRVLCAHGADPTLVNHRGETPAATARRNGHWRASRLLDSPEP
jgi:cytohesin